MHLTENICEYVCASVATFIITANQEIIVWKGLLEIIMTICTPKVLSGNACAQPGIVQ